MRGVKAELRLQPRKGGSESVKPRLSECYIVAVLYVIFSNPDQLSVFRLYTDALPEC